MAKPKPPAALMRWARAFANCRIQQPSKLAVDETWPGFPAVTYRPPAYGKGKILLGEQIVLLGYIQEQWIPVDPTATAKARLPRSVQQMLHETQPGQRLQLDSTHWWSADVQNPEFGPANGTLRTFTQLIAGKYMRVVPDSYYFDAADSFYSPPLRCTLERTSLAVPPPRSKPNKGMLPWKTQEHRRRAEQSPAARHLEWLRELGTPNVPHPSRSVALIRELLRHLEGASSQGRELRWSLKQILVCQQMVEFHAAVAMVRPIYNEGKIVRLEPMDLEEAAEVVRKTLAWPGALTAT